VGTQKNLLSLGRGLYETKIFPKNEAGDAYFPPILPRGVYGGDTEGETCRSSCQDQLPAPKEPYWAERGFLSVLSGKQALFEDRARLDTPSLPERVIWWRGLRARSFIWFLRMAGDIEGGLIL